MKCPHCGYHDSKVLDSRDTSEGIRRRRQCLGCDGRFTTYEKQQQGALFVIKKDRRREPFLKSKLLNGVRKACEKRPIPAHVLEKLTDEIEADLQALGRAEVASGIIGDMVMERLKHLDHIAYIRFASIYRDFADITRLKQEVDTLAGLDTKPSTQLPLMPAPAGEVARAGRRAR